MTGLTKTVVALVVMVCLVGAARGQEQDNSQTIDLTDELSKTSAGIVTPSRLLAGRNKWTGKGVPMTLTVAGHDVMARIDPAHFGVDTNRDGAVSTQEREVTRGKDEHIFKIRIEDGPDGQKRYIGVIFKEVHPSGRSGAYSGRMAPASCKTATIDGVIVRIYDDNMDGKYTVDGSDAVAIGESAKGAAPLYPANKIGKGFYELAIAEDGSTLTVTPMVNPETALVSMSTDPDKYITVIITDGTKACDLTQVSEMLSGEYKLLYAAAAGAKNVPIIIIPSDKAVTYDVEANKTNELQFGEPFLGEKVVSSRYFFRPAAWVDPSRFADLSEETGVSCESLRLIHLVAAAVMFAILGAVAVYIFRRRCAFADQFRRFARSVAGACFFVGLGLYVGTQIVGRSVEKWVAGAAPDWAQATNFSNSFIDEPLEFAAALCLAMSVLRLWHGELPATCEAPTGSAP